MQQLLIAAFPDRTHADRVFAELENHGYTAQDLSVISKADATTHVEHTATGDAAAGAAGGVATGSVLGGLAGFLAGAGVFPALAGLLIGGPIAAALGLTGIAAATVSGALTGAAAGGLIGALMNLGLTRTEAEYYDETINAGGLLMAIPVTEATEAEARALLVANHAQQIKLVTTNVLSEDVAATRMTNRTTEREAHRAKGKAALETEIVDEEVHTTRARR